MGFFSGGAGTAALNAGGQIAAANIAAKSNREAAEKQYGYQLDLINRQNVYNSPANQMKRLQEAGLNPNLVYGGGAVTGNQSGTGSAPTVQSAGDYGLGKALESINTYMAVQNHDMDMQMKQQQLIQNADTHKAEMQQAGAQLIKTMTEDKVLNSQLLTNQITNDILKHDKKIIDSNPYVKSNSKYMFDFKKGWNDLKSNLSSNLKKGMYDEETGEIRNWRHDLRDLKRRFGWN